MNAVATSRKGNKQKKREKKINAGKECYTKKNNKKVLTNQPLENKPISRQFLRCPAGYLRNWQSASSGKDSSSTVNYGKDQFSANPDVQLFKPEEISGKVTGDREVTIEEKYEEKEDEHGHIYIHFIRRYVMPKNYDMGKIE
ncbi:unnamed protein product [Diabrotica balteata]|uniref:SHSP domain-containing protein n=1 Tax=Diabrotica balteata TaxID=107213 RepID=A0A9N9XCE7_DIABA|nr:unnamed protein product [Diabrotica balteata]